MHAWYDDADFFSRGRGKFFAIAARLRQVCLQRKPDLVICWPTGFANWVALGARLAGVRRVLVHCGNPPNRGAKQDWITRYVMWPVAFLGARCVCCSDYVKGLFQSVPGVYRRMFFTVHNCARGTRWPFGPTRPAPHGTPQTGKRAIMVATLESHKDHATALQALRFVLERDPTFRLVFAGEGSLRPVLEALGPRNWAWPTRSSSWGRGGTSPSFSGRPTYLSSPPRPQEGLGTVLLEALAAKLPVIASDVPACR